MLGSRLRILLSFAAGLLVGVAAGVLSYAYWTESRPEYVLTKDLAIGKGPGRPELGVEGLLQRGTCFRVTQRKGDVNYVQLDAIFFDKELVGNAEAATGGGVAPWNVPVPRPGR